MFDFILFQCFVKTPKSRLRLPDSVSRISSRYAASVLESDTGQINFSIGCLKHNVFGVVWPISCAVYGVISILLSFSWTGGRYTEIGIIPASISRLR
ncbi:hypothetical protein D3C85_1585110 [compost metagenome]